jgi:hypothetical protein
MVDWTHNVAKDVLCLCAGCKVSKAPQWMTKGTEKNYLHCSKCHKRVHETYTFDQLCIKCHMEAKMAKQAKPAEIVPARNTQVEFTGRVFR